MPPGNGQRRGRHGARVGDEHPWKGSARADRAGGLSWACVDHHRHLARHSVTQRLGELTGPADDHDGAQISFLRPRILPPADHVPPTHGNVARIAPLSVTRTDTARTVAGAVVVAD